MSAVLCSSNAFLRSLEDGPARRLLGGWVGVCAAAVGGGVTPGCKRYAAARGLIPLHQLAHICGRLKSSQNRVGDVALSPLMLMIDY